MARVQINTEYQQFREEIVICALFFVKTCGEYIKLTIVTIQLQGSPGKYILISPPLQFCENFVIFDFFRENM